MICLSTAYLAPVSYYQRLMGASHVMMEAHENYTKQTYRNRALIAAPQGIMPLTIPIQHNSGEKILMKDVRLSDHGNWRHLHWQALQTAYDKSPFFEFYADDFRPFYEGKPTTFLLDFNMQLQETVCRLIGITPSVALTETYLAEGNFLDLRNAFSPKQREMACPQYYQVFSQKHGFLPDLSVVDLLFNMGPESILVLKQS